MEKVQEMLLERHLLPFAKGNYWALNIEIHMPNLIRITRKTPLRYNQTTDTSMQSGIGRAALKNASARISPRVNNVTLDVRKLHLNLLAPAEMP